MTFQFGTRACLACIALLSASFAACGGSQGGASSAMLGNGPQGIETSNPSPPPSASILIGPSPSAVPSPTNPSPAPSVSVVSPSPQPTPSASEEPESACDGYRWPTKIGADPAASSVLLTPQAVTISDLNATRPPATLPENGRVAPAETAVYKLTNVKLTHVDLESDLDYHLIASDGAAHTVTLESVDPSCAGSSLFQSQLTAVRAYINAHMHVPGRPNLRITVTGIGFFDPPGSGGLELHPVLAICVGEDCSL